MFLNINDDAIFISDSHTQRGREELVNSLNNLGNAYKKLPSQIILLGDISNLLIGKVRSSSLSNKHLIDCINNIKTNIIYIEGNHDFNLKNQFLDHVIVVDRLKQPIICKYRNKNVLISHGDIFIDYKYEIYRRLIGSKITIMLMNAMDVISMGKIYDLIKNKVEKKIIKHPYNEMELIKTRIDRYKRYIHKCGSSIDIVIEGHFHIGKIINTREIISDADFVYVAMPSFYHGSKIFSIMINDFRRI